MDDIWICIAEWMDIHSLLKMQLTCKHMKTLLKSTIETALARELKWLHIRVSREESWVTHSIPLKLQTRWKLSHDVICRFTACKINDECIVKDFENWSQYNEMVRLSSKRRSKSKDLYLKGRRSDIYLFENDDNDNDIENFVPPFGHLEITIKRDVVFVYLTIPSTTKTLLCPLRVELALTQYVRDPHWNFAEPRKWWASHGWMFCDRKQADRIALILSVNPNSTRIEELEKSFKETISLYVVKHLYPWVVSVDDVPIRDFVKYVRTQPIHCL